MKTKTKRGIAKGALIFGVYLITQALGLIEHGFYLWGALVFLLSVGTIGVSLGKLGLFA